jgi:hypothetical protein
VPAVSAAAPTSHSKLTSAKDRLRELSNASQRVPPFQRERVQAENGNSLVPGGPPAPADYPDEVAWPHADIPPGSNYSAKEWAAAKTDALGVPCAVIELQNSVKSLLLQFPLAAPLSARRSKSVVYQGGKAVVCDAPADPGINVFGLNLASTFGDCLFVTQTAWPAFPGAAEAKFVNNDITLRVIRPRADYTDLERMWRVGARWTSSAEVDADGPGDEPGADSPAP